MNQKPVGAGLVSAHATTKRHKNVGVGVLDDPLLRRNSKKNNRGITLIALVITIITMLILTGVTINIATDGELFTYAKRAADDTNSAIADENQILAALLEGKSLNDIVEDPIAPILSSPWLYGDANLDGDIDEDDVTRARAAYLSQVQLNEIEFIQADVDADGAITSVDVSRVKAYVLGKLGTLVPANAQALNAYNVTSSSFKLRIKAQDEDSGLSKIIWHYKLSSAENYTSVEELITNTTEATILEKELTGLTAGEYTAYVEVFDAKNNKATSNSVTVTIE